MNSRAQAAGILTRVLAGRVSLTGALEGALPKIANAKDRAFVQALCYGVMRWYWRLDFLLQQLVARPIRDEEISVLALVGLYQLEYTRVKPYAAVAETVAAAEKKRWAKALLNGVLRTYQRERDRLQRLADEDASARYSHPAWLMQRVRQDWPTQADAIFHQSNSLPPLALRVNERRSDRESYLQRLQQAGISAHPHGLVRTAIMLDEAVPVEQLPGFDEGLASVQDVAAQLAAVLLDIRPGLRVLDVCAAPGGKTSHILEVCPQIELVAVDLIPERIERVRRSLERTGGHAKVLCGDALSPEKWWDGKSFDRILVDAPCSAIGVIRRHPDIKWLRQPEDMAQLAATQLKILEAIWPLLAPGGLLVYATCSLMKQENEDVIAKFLEVEPQALEHPIDANWGMGLSHGRQIFPGDHDMDGFYYACLKK